jgi:hypothetical protein
MTSLASRPEFAAPPWQSSILLIRPASSSRPRLVSASDRHQLSLRSAPTLCSKAQSNKRTVFDDEDDRFTMFHSQVSLTRKDALLYSSSSRRKPIQTDATRIIAKIIGPRIRSRLTWQMGWQSPITGPDFLAIRVMNWNSFRLPNKSGVREFL